MHKLYTAVDKSLHRTRHGQIKVTHMTFFICWIKFNLMNTLHMNTEYVLVIFVNIIKKIKTFKKSDLILFLSMCV